MATRSRTTWKPRSDGQYDGRVGWKLSLSGKREQHRFRLGGDLKEAKRRDHLLRQMWEKIEAIHPSDAVWNDDTLQLARLVAKGTAHLFVPRRPDEGVIPYAQRVCQLRQSFPMLAILPEPDYGSAFGVNILETLEAAYAEADLSLDAQREADAQAFRRRMIERVPQEDVTSSHAGPTLHDALRGYSDWLKSEYNDPDAGVSPWGRTQMRQVSSLIAHHPNMPLARLGRDEVEELFRYWRQRPIRRGSTQRVSKKSASHFICVLRSFFKWLHVRPPFGWRKPEGFEELKTRVSTLSTERRLQVKAEQLFSLDELKILYRYAKPLDRLLMLLGLNCGFGAAESASLLVGELFIRVPHSQRHQEMLGFEASAGDSFIKRVRRKSGVYGEFLLFDHTVRGLEWALAERRRDGKCEATNRLLLNGSGEPYDKPTKTGNTNRQIPNRFARLMQQIADDEQKISQLPFKTFRKTGGDLVKRFSDGEVAGVFLCHGQPVASDELSDAYTQRPFGKVFERLRQVQEYLSPVWKEAGATPFE